MKSQVVPSKKPGTIAVAAIPLIILGIISVIDGLFLILFRIEMGMPAHHHAFYHLSFIGVIGFIAIVLGILELLSGWLLWNLKGIGAVLAITATVIGLVTLLFTQTPFMLLKLVSTILVLVFIALGWQYLK